MNRETEAQSSKTAPPKSRQHLCSLIPRTTLISPLAERLGNTLVEPALGPVLWTAAGKADSRGIEGTPQGPS